MAFYRVPPPADVVFVCAHDPFSPSFATDVYSDSDSDSEHVAHAPEGKRPAPKRKRVRATRPPRAPSAGPADIIGATAGAEGPVPAPEAPPSELPLTARPQSQWRLAQHRDYFVRAVEALTLLINEGGPEATRQLEAHSVMRAYVPLALMRLGDPPWQRPDAWNAAFDAWTVYMWALFALGRADMPSVRINPHLLADPLPSTRKRTTRTPAPLARSRRLAGAAPGSP